MFVIITNSKRFYARLQTQTICCKHHRWSKQIASFFSLALRTFPLLWAQKEMVSCTINLVARLGPSSPLLPQALAWQASHFATSTFTLWQAWHLWRISKASRLPRSLSLSLLQAHERLFVLLQVCMVENRSYNRGYKCLFSVLQKARCFALTLLSPMRIWFAWHAQYFWQSWCEKLTAFSVDFGGRCGIYGVCDTEPTEGERLVRQLWHYTPFTEEKTAKQIQRAACSGSFF